MVSDIAEVITHILNEEYSGSICQTAIMGDKGITIIQALDQSNDLKFNCTKCMIIISNSYGIDPAS